MTTSSVFSLPTTSDIQTKSLPQQLPRHHLFLPILQHNRNPHPSYLHLNRTPLITTLSFFSLSLSLRTASAFTFSNSSFLIITYAFAIPSPARLNFSSSPLIPFTPSTTPLPFLSYFSNISNFTTFTNIRKSPK